MAKPFRPFGNHCLIDSSNEKETRAQGLKRDVALVVVVALVLVVLVLLVVIGSSGSISTRSLDIQRYCLWMNAVSSTCLRAHMCASAF